MTDVKEISERVAQACRVIGKLDLTKAATGHLSMRIPGTDTIAIRARGAFNGGSDFMTLAVLTGIGFEWMLAWLESKRRALAIAAFTAIGAWLLWPASIMLRLHPYESLFFNPLVGGLEGAQQRYDTDYWVNVMGELVTELEAMLDREKLDREGKPSRRYYVAVCGERVPFDRLAAPP